MLQSAPYTSLQNRRGFRLLAAPCSDVRRPQWIAFVGKLSLEKGVHCLIAAAPEIIARIPQARLLLIGDGVARQHLVKMRDVLAEGDLDLAAEAMQGAARTSPESYAEWVAEYWAGLDLDAYRRQAVAAQLKQSVIFTGYQTAAQVARLINRADLLVIPSLIKEAFPLVSVEALASGLMFVAPYIGGLAPALDWVSAEMGAVGSLARITYQPEHLIPELIDRVDRLLSYTADETRRLELATLARNFALKHYDWTNIVSRIESVYVSALYGHSL
jgi:glycosyltransferase involved in cell wall biosynthesis